MSELGEDPFAQDDVAKVAEMASEPSYISEIARKLQQVDPRFQTFKLQTVINIVARSVQALEETHHNVEITHVKYSNYGGQAEASPIYSLQDDGVGVSDEWYPYTLVHVKNQPVRDEYRDVIDKSITIDEKTEMIDTLSGDGNEVSQEAELIMQDMVNSRVFRDIEYYETPSYNDGGVDLYIENFRSNITGNLKTYEKGVIIEISVRWVNPIGIPYMDEKTDKRKDYEEDRDVPVDLIVLAPNFTGSVENTYSDSGIERIGRVPENPTGNPILLEDTEDTIELAKNLPFTGNKYPVVKSSRQNMLDALASVGRDYDEIYELEYRRELLAQIGRLIA